MHVLDPDDMTLLDIWQARRAGGMGGAALPFAGGIADQPACVMAALDIMDRAADRLRPRR